MSKQIETKNFLVSNGQELITKAKEYKNSGSEWKLLEFYYTCPAKGDNKREYEWGIIIKNGEKEVNIKSVNNNEINGKTLNNDDSDGSKFLTNALDMNKVWDELCKIFPKAKPARNGPHYSLKKIKKNGEDYLLGRYLVAENSWHLKNILRQYVRDNETKIYQSVNSHFSGWVDIIDGQDGNIYLYVGEKKDGDGREIKIGIAKSEFENCKRDEDDVPNKALEGFWGLFTLGRPLTPTETRNYHYQGTEEDWQITQKFWEQTCRASLESLRDRMNEKLNYLEKELSAPDRDRELTKTRWQILTIDHRLKYMKENHPDWYNNYNKTCPDCEMRMCCHKEGQACKKNKQHLLENKICLQGGDISQPPISPKTLGNTNQITETEKSQLLQYFLKNNIESIKLEEGNLVITYKSQNQETKMIEGEELQKIQNSLQNQPNQYLSLAQLQTNTNHSNPELNNYESVIGLTIGGAILMGIIIFSTLIIRKRNKKISKN